MQRSISSLMVLPFVAIGLIGGCSAEPDELLLARSHDDDDDDNDDDLTKKEKKQLAKEVRQIAQGLGLAPMPAPPKVSNKLTKLGKALTFDKILSGNKNISCITCHHPNTGSDDDRHLSVGEGAVGLGVDRLHPDDVFIPRNAPPLFNLHAMADMFWDGRVNVHNGVYDTPANAKLSPDMIAVFNAGLGVVGAQAMFPVTSRREMRGIMGTNELATIGDDLFSHQ